MNEYRFTAIFILFIGSFPILIFPIKTEVKRRHILLKISFRLWWLRKLQLTVNLSLHPMMESDPFTEKKQKKNSMV
jgi:hypothetical protein